MIVEVEAMRKGVDVQQKRLAERSVALDRQKREVDAAARAEKDRSTEEVRYRRVTSKYFADYRTESFPSSICLSCVNHLA